MNDNCCGNGDKCCENASIIAAVVPDELKKLVALVTQLSDDYTKAVSGNKKRTTAARKGLMEIKKLAGEMRKTVFEKNRGLN